MTLADLQPGQSGLIHAVDAAAPGVLRLMTLGLVEGTPVHFRQAAIGGDPIEVTVMGAAVSLRLEQARSFAIQGAPATVADRR